MELLIQTSLMFLGVLLLLFGIFKFAKLIYEVTIDDVVKAVKKELKVSSLGIDLRQIDRDVTDHKYDITGIQRRLSKLETPEKKKK